MMERKIDESLLLDFLSGHVTQREKVRIEKWYDESESNRKLIEDIYYINFLCDCTAAVKHINVERSLAELKERFEKQEITSCREVDNARKKSSVARRILRYTAAAAIVALAAIGIAKLSAPGPRLLEAYANGGMITSLTLADGTIVELQPNTHITYPARQKGGKYEVTLEGEATFSVTKRQNGTRFIANALGTQVVVKGTTFSLRAYDDEETIEATLYNGAIDFVAGKNVIELMPDQRLVYNRVNNNIIISDITVPEEHTFVLEKLESVILTLSDYYGCRIVLESSMVGNIEFTGTVSSGNDLEHTLQVVTIATGTRYRVYEDGTVVIHQ